jgi:CRP/FNR family transcriptional regulator, cyclic AMP receptor protein
LPRERTNAQKPQPTLWANANDPDKLLALTGTGRTTADYQNNQYIFIQGEVADSVFIQKGRVRVAVTTEHGKEAAVGIVDEGQIFGENCLHGQTLGTAWTKALGDCRITSITKDAMLSAIRRNSPNCSRDIY